MSRRALRFIGPALVAVAAVAMLAWSWGTWPDPLVDFGAQLYVPWRISAGQSLYRDIAYYNGPLSSYLNAAAFLIGGVSIRTLVWMNVAILAATMVIAYRLTVRAAGRGTAILGGITFALVFAFGQNVLIGNYNWVTPYTHEITHGAALALAAIAATSRYQRTGKTVWIAITGMLLGLVFLTKAEPTAAGWAAVIAQLIAGWWHHRINRREMAKKAGIFLVFAGVPPVAAGLLLMLAMPAHEAIRGVMGSWPWAFDRRVTSLIFYRNVTGLNDVAGNLAIMGRWSAGYVAMFLLAIGLGKLTRARAAAIAAFVVTLAALMEAFHHINWNGMLTPLPLCLLAALVIVAIHLLRRDDTQPYALRLSLIIFSLVLLAKMGLKPHSFHYGFVLAWPGTMVLIALVGSNVSPIVRAVGLAAWSVAVFAVLNRDAIIFGDKQFIVTGNTGDTFRANSCGLEVQLACDAVRAVSRPGDTLAVFPQGLMINYLTRRVNPIPNVNFMPPEVLAAGEAGILAALKQHPPDVVILTSSVVQDHRFTLDGRDDYGGDVLRWIKEHYKPVDVVTLPAPMPTIYRFVVSVKIK